MHPMQLEAAWQSPGSSICTDCSSRLQGSNTCVMSLCCIIKTKQQLLQQQRPQQQARHTPLTVAQECAVALRGCSLPALAQGSDVTWASQYC